jgi:hypothetical protein
LKTLCYMTALREILKAQQKIYVLDGLHVQILCNSRNALFCVNQLRLHNKRPVKSAEVAKRLGYESAAQLFETISKLRDGTDGH